MSEKLTRKGIEHYKKTHNLNLRNDGIKKN